MCLLHGGNIAVASSFDDKVKMFDTAGTYLGPVLPGTSGKFSRPADMVCLGSGEFVVKDDTKLRLFSSEGVFISVICEHLAATKCFGLAEDDQGRLVCIRRTGRDTDLVFWDVGSKQIVKRMTLEDIIADKANSKCRFLTFQGGKIYITDLGLNKVYVIDAKTYTVIKVTHVVIGNHMILSCSGVRSGGLRAGLLRRPCRARGGRRGEHGGGGQQEPPAGRLQCRGRLPRPAASAGGPAAQRAAPRLLQQAPLRPQPWRPDRPCQVQTQLLRIVLFSVHVFICCLPIRAY
jgi:YVTN family beta-propeller protein